MDFLDRQIELGSVVEEFPVVGYWNDVGRPEDHARAEQDLAEGRVAPDAPGLDVIACEHAELALYERLGAPGNRRPPRALRRDVA